MLVVVQGTPGSQGIGTRNKAVLLTIVGMFPDLCRARASPKPQASSSPLLLGKNPIFQEHALSMPGKVSCDLGYKSLGREVSSSDYKIQASSPGEQEQTGGTEVTWRTGQRPLSLC